VPEAAQERRGTSGDRAVRADGHPFCHLDRYLTE
jgi:hypothetical protein